MLKKNLTGKAGVPIAMRSRKSSEGSSHVFREMTRLE